MANTEIVCRENGPFLVTGDIEIKDAEGNVFDLGGKTTVALCRCGASGKRPFCDGSHKACDFQSNEKAV